MTDSGKTKFFSCRNFLIFLSAFQFFLVTSGTPLSAQDMLPSGEKTMTLEAPSDISPEKAQGITGEKSSPQSAATGKSSPETASKAPGSSADNILFFPGEISSAPAFLVPDPFSTSLRVLTSLIIVLCMVFGLSWFIQKRVGINRSVFGKVIGVFPLDGRRFIYLVEIMGKVLVLGVTEQQINLLCEINDKPTLDALRLQSETPTTPGLEKMFPFLKRNSPNEDYSSMAEIPSHTEMTQQQKQQVEKLIIRREPPGNESRRQ